MTGVPGCEIHCFCHIVAWKDTLATFWSISSSSVIILYCRGAMIQTARAFLKFMNYTTEKKEQRKKKPCTVNVFATWVKCYFCRWIVSHIHVSLQSFITCMLCGRGGSLTSPLSAGMTGFQEVKACFSLHQIKNTSDSTRVLWGRILKFYCKYYLSELLYSQKSSSMNLKCPIVPYHQGCSFLHDGVTRALLWVIQLSEAS